jgi:WD40 repeat protein
MAFTRDGHTLAIGLGDGRVLLWDVSDPVRPRRLGQPLTIHRFLLDIQPADLSVAFTPDARTLATGDSIDRMVLLWDLSDPVHPRRLGQPLTGHSGSVASVALAPNGRTLAATGGLDQTVLLWDVSNRVRPRRLGQPLIGDSRSVDSVAFAPDGYTLATATGDGKAVLWDVSDPARPRRLGQPLTGHKSFVGSVVFAPDGRTLATSGEDRKVFLWDLTELNELRRHATDHACSLTGRGLDHDEWVRYVSGLPYQTTCPG